VGFLEGLATAALTWNGSAFTALAVAGTPGEMPGSNLQDIDAPTLNNNGEIAARCIIAPSRSCLMFGSSDGTPHVLLFDGSAGGGVTNLRNFSTTRYNLNDNSTMLFRADYWNYGSTVTQTGLFTVTPDGAVTLVIPAGTPLTGITGTYSFNQDFGIANDGSILFSVNAGGSPALFRRGPDGAIARVIGAGDKLNGSIVTSVSPVTVGRNGHYAAMVSNGSQNLLSAGDPAQFRQLPIGSYNTVLHVSSAGEALVWCSIGGAYGLYRWDGTRTRTVALLGFPSPLGEPYTQFDAGAITGTGNVVLQARTANSLLLVVNAGAAMGSKSSVIFQTGARVNVPAGPSFYNLVLNGHMGNPMIKTGWLIPNVYEIADGALIPRLISGDRTPDGWFYEGNQDVRRTGDGDILVSTDQSVSQISDRTAALLAHFPQRTLNGNLNTFFQVAGNASGTVAGTGGTSFGVQHLSLIKDGVVKTLAWIGASGNYRTAAPGGGNFAGSNDLGVAEDGTVYASLRVTGGPDGLFTWDGSAWTSLLRIGDPYDGFNVTSIGTIRVAGKALYVILNSGFQHLARYQDGKWTDVISFGDAVPNGGTVNGINAFDVNRNGTVAAVLNANGTQYALALDGNGMRTAVDTVHQLDGGEALANIFQISIHDDGRIFATAINTQQMMVLYEFDPIP
jgi:hypothetical protein